MRIHNYYEVDKKDRKTKTNQFIEPNLIYY